jgi:hypothetical protein
VTLQPVALAGPEPRRRAVLIRGPAPIAIPATLPSPTPAGKTLLGISSFASGLPVPPGGGVPVPSGTPTNLKVIDWAGFKGAVTYTFDDSQPSQIEHYAQLEAVGIHVTFYLSSGWASTSSQYDATWQRAVRDGHEIGNHTVHHCHADLTGCSVGASLGSQLAEIDTNAAYISQHEGQGVVSTMASPFGDGNWANFARQRVFLSRDVNRGMVAPNDSTDPFHLPCFMAGDASIGGVGTQQSAFNGFIDTARSGDRWLIFLFHTITPVENWPTPALLLLARGVHGDGAPCATSPG